MPRVAKRKASKKNTTDDQSLDEIEDEQQQPVITVVDKTKSKTSVKRKASSSEDKVNQ